MIEKFYNDVRTMAWWIPFKKTRHAMRNILHKIGEQERNLVHSQQRYMRILSDMILYKDTPKVFLLQTPEYGNVGDQAIALGTQFFLESYCKESVVLQYSLNDIALCVEVIEKFINKKDIIFLQGGGNFGNLWIEIEEERRNLIARFPHNTIIIFPVSITFSQDESGQKELAKSKECYSAHKHLNIMARDEESYSFAKRHFAQNNIILIPDAACNLTKNLHFHTTRKDSILLIFRNDKEKVLQESMAQSLKENLKNAGLAYKQSDTCIEEYGITQAQRKHCVTEMLQTFASHRLVITDRFHGMLFSYITKTPCIVFPSLDHKIPSGYKWLSSLPWIYKVKQDDSIESIMPQIKRLIAYNECTDSIQLDSTFWRIFDENFGTLLHNKQTYKKD